MHADEVDVCIFYSFSVLVCCLYLYVRLSVCMSVCPPPHPVLSLLFSRVMLLRRAKNSCTWRAEIVVCLDYSGTIGALEGNGRGERAANWRYCNDLDATIPRSRHQPTPSCTPDLVSVHTYWRPTCIVNHGRRKRGGRNFTA